MNNPPRNCERILMLSEYFHPHWTGLAKSFLNLACDLRDRGHSITVLTTRYSTDLPSNEDYQGIKIVRAPCLFYISRTNYSIKVLIDGFRLMKDCDVVIINSPFSNILFSVISAKLRAKKVIIYHQGDLLLARQTGSKVMNYIIERAFDVFTIPAMALSDSIVTYTLDYAKHSRVMRHFLHKFQAVIPRIYLPNGEVKPEFASKLDTLQNKGQLVGFAGRFVEEKGFDILFRAMPHILKEMPHVNFAFAGDTNVYYEKFFDRAADLIANLKDKVHFLGLLAAGDLAKFYKALDVFVLCSRSDCFALTQVEAALSGVPLVVSDIPGARSFVKETGAGLLVKSEDPQALAVGILAILRQRNKFIPDQKRISTYLKTYEQLELS